MDWLLANHCQDFINRPLISLYFNSRSIIILHVSRSSLFPNQVNGWSSLEGRNVGLIQYILVMIWQDPSSWGMSHIFSQQVLSLKTNASMETRQTIEIFWTGGESPSVFCSFMLAIFRSYVLSSIFIGCPSILSLEMWCSINYLHNSIAQALQLPFLLYQSLW